MNEEELEKMVNEKAQAEYLKVKAQTENKETALIVQEPNKNEIATAQTRDGNDTSLVLREKKKQVLSSEEVNQIANRIAAEDIKADFANEAARINKKNMDAAEQELDNRTRQRKLQRLNAELDLQHKYNMSMIKQNGEHQQMLDKKKKLVEQYGYLYDWNKTVKAKDGENNEYEVPYDFSYSKTVNRFREFGRNISKLDKPLLQTIKWILILGGCVLGFFVFKWTGVI